VQQCFLVYDGLHYDALAMAAFEGSPEEVDCTVVGVDDADLPQVRGRAVATARTLLLRCICWSGSGPPVHVVCGHVVCACALADTLAHRGLSQPDAELSSEDSS
jgi:hypothetical protein